MPRAFAQSVSLAGVARRIKRLVAEVDAACEKVFRNRQDLGEVGPMGGAIDAGDQQAAGLPTSQKLSGFQNAIRAAGEGDDALRLDDQRRLVPLQRGGETNKTGDERGSEKGANACRRERQDSPRAGLARLRNLTLIRHVEPLPDALPRSRPPETKAGNGLNSAGGARISLVP